jgi:peptide/nickel transport system substrate-binding protein
MRRRPTVLGATVAASVVVLAGCTDTLTGTTPTGTLTPPGPTATVATSSAPTQRPLVVETVFGHVDLDPTRHFGRTNAIVAKALYQTLTTFSSADQTQPEPGLAQYTISPEGNWLTLRLRADAKFSDGTAVTTDDVIYTLNRALGLGGPPATVLGNIRMTKVDERTMTITSPDSNFALPAILANPAFGILNSSAVKAQGGTIGPGDAASSWLQTHSAGSGPYVLASRTEGSITLRANPHWSGPAPAHPEVVLRDASSGEQVKDLEAGRADVVLDLSPVQTQAIQQDPADMGLGVVTRRSSTVAYLMLNASPKVNRWSADPDFVEAVRSGIDSAALAKLVGGGAVPATGLIPQGIVGALKPAATNRTPTPPPGPTAVTSPSAPPVAPSAPSATLPEPTITATSPNPGGAGAHDGGAARAALKRAGYDGQALALVYAEDEPIQGIPPRALAEAVARQLGAVGITVHPKGMPAAQARAAYDSGTEAFGLWSFTPDFPGPENYLLFAPGHPIGLRAAWPLRASPLVDELTIEALNSVGDDRQAAYRAWQRAVNSSGPFIPLLQPASRFAHGPRVTSVVTNPIWTVDLAQTR